jgi:ribulose-phosphate 3-epimerase
LRGVRRLYAEAGLSAILKPSGERPAGHARELMRSLLVEPSILSADYARLGEELERVLDAGARAIHVDVMDGHFVPPITIGPVIVEAIRDQVHDAGAILDCHLMIEQPERQVEQFVQAGADSITIQVESTPNVHYALGKIRDAGCMAGLAINPGTPVSAVEELRERADFVLCMTVNPGWGGQAFIEDSPDKVRRLRAVLGPDVPIQVDGGISTQTAGAATDAGASLLVAGSAIFHASDPAEAYREILRAAGG